MKIIEKTEATAPLAEYTTGVKKEPVIVTRKGKPIAALIERSRTRQRTEGGISSEEMRRRLGMRKAGRA